MHRFLQQASAKTMRAMRSKIDVARITVTPTFSRMLTGPSRARPIFSEPVPSSVYGRPKKSAILFPMLKSSRNSPMAILLISLNNTFVYWGYLTYQAAMYTQCCIMLIRIQRAKSTLFARSRSKICQIDNPTPTASPTCASCLISSSSSSVIYGSSSRLQTLNSSQNSCKFSAFRIIHCNLSLKVRTSSSFKSAEMSRMLSYSMPNSIDFGAISRRQTLAIDLFRSSSETSST